MKILNIEEVKKAFKNAKIPVDFYSKGPMGKDNFAINIYNRKVKLFLGNSKLEIIHDKKHRQLIINVDEDSRLVSANRRYSKDALNLTLNSKKATIIKRLKEIDGKVYRKRFGNHIPGSSKPISIKISDVKNEYSNFTVSSTFKVRGSKFSFLVGYDEKTSTSPFISRLKKRVKSVVEAHKQLRPTGLKKNSLRQGEWFFEPVNKKRNSELYAKLTERSHYTGRRDSFIGSTHRAGIVMKHTGERYVIGKITDTRRGRHEPLVLENWHRLVRNNEADADDRKGARSNMWD